MLPNLLIRNTLFFGLNGNVLKPACATQVALQYDQQRGAARKGKRIAAAMEARKRANLRRLREAQNPKSKRGFNRSVKLDKTLMRFRKERQRDDTLPEPPEDDVYFTEPFRKKRISLTECLELHRQAIHPEVLNKPNALVEARIELNLKLKIKKKKYVDSFASTLKYPHPFSFYVKPRKILALCADPNGQVAAKNAGAFISGGADILLALKKGQITVRDFDHLVCHSDILLDLANIKGMRNNKFFPTKARGNSGDDIVELVKFFREGLDYNLEKDEIDPAIGWVDCPFGRFDMSNEQLRENLNELIASIKRFEPLNLPDDTEFLRRVLIKTPETDELFVLDPIEYSAPTSDDANDEGSASESIAQ